MNTFIQDLGYVVEENSKKFLSIYYPEKLDENESYITLLIPRDSSKHDKTKALLSLLSDILMSTDINVAEYKGTTNKEGVDIKMVEMLRTLSYFIGYLSNCSSWENKKIEDFDKMELRKRLSNLIRYFN